MEPAASLREFAAGVVTGIAVPTAVSVLSDGWELFEPRGLGTALGLTIVAIIGLLVRDCRMFALGTLLGAALYVPIALVWAAGQGMSLGG
jgi:hypothetical protein